MKRKKSLFLNKKIWLIILGLGLTFFAVYNFIPKKLVINYETIIAKRGTLVQTVSETGVIKLPQTADLNFDGQGKIKEITVKIGDHVEKDQVLARLDVESLLIKKREALASYEITKANLEKLRAGATKQDLAISEANVASAKSAHQSAKNELIKVKASVDESVSQATKSVNDLWSPDEKNITAYEQAIIIAETNLANIKTTYQESVNNSIDKVLIDAEAKMSAGTTALDTIKKVLDDPDAKEVLSVKNLVYLTKTKNDRDLALGYIDDANQVLAVAQNSKINKNVISLIDKTTLALNKVFSALGNCFSILENSYATASFTQSELNAYKSEISTQNTTISAAISSIQTDKQSYNSANLAYSTNTQKAEKDLDQARVNYNNALLQTSNAQSTVKLSGDQQLQIANTKVEATSKALLVAEANLNKIKARANVHDLELAQFQVDQAQASFDYVNEQVKGSEIIAPFKGSIAKVNYEVNEQFSPSKAAISILGDSEFEIEVLVSETDILKITKGNKVNITLDSLGSDVKLSGYVDFIEPAETKIQDIIYYKIKIKFNSDVSLDKIKHGMTANVEIMTASRENIIVVAQRAVIDKGGEGKFIRLLKNKESIEKNIQIGLRGDGGQIEIISGVEEGDEVILYVKK